jgi:hypothetical protein
MTDTSTFEEIQIAEDELIDDYLNGILSPRENEIFESFFLAAAERRQKLEFARSLKHYIASMPLKEHPSWIASLMESLAFWQWQNPSLAWSMAAAFLLLLMVGGSWSIIRFRQGLSSKDAEALQQQLAQLQTHNSHLSDVLKQEQEQRNQLARELAMIKTGEKKELPQPGTVSPALLSFALLPGLVREMEGPKRLMIPAGTQLVRFQLQLGENEYPKYRAILQTMENEEIWMQTWPRTGPSGEMLGSRLIVPAALLTKGDYILKLAGINGNGNWEEIGKYYFRVVAQ